MDDKTVGQATGLRDKNGCDIYEGDIYALDFGNSRSFDNYCVHYRNGAWIGVAHDDGWRTLNPDADEPYRDDLYQIEVIGNIHDNPELIK